MVEPIPTPSAGAVGKEHERPTPTANTSGRITETIGRGEDAKNSIVWMTITWSFFIGATLSLLLFSLVVADKDFKYIDSIKDVWTVFVPLITLALGYAFGKSK